MDLKLIIVIIVIIGIVLGTVSYYIKKDSVSEADITETELEDYITKINALDVSDIHMHPNNVEAMDKFNQLVGKLVEYSNAAKTIIEQRNKTPEALNTLMIAFRRRIRPKYEEFNRAIVALKESSGRTSIIMDIERRFQTT